MNLLKQLSNWYWKSFLNKWTYQDKEGNIITEEEFNKRAFEDTMFSERNEFRINHKTKTIKLI